MYGRRGGGEVAEGRGGQVAEGKGGGGGGGGGGGMYVGYLRYRTMSLNYSKPTHC